MLVGIDGRELGEGVCTGIGRYVIGVLRAAGGEGMECVVYGDRATRPELALPGVSFRALTRGWTPWWDQVTLPRQVGRDGVSVLLSPYYKAPLLPPCPVVVTIHDLFFIEYLGRRRLLHDAIRRRLAQLYARRAAAVITDSEYSKRAVVERLGLEPGKVTVIPVALGPDFAPQPLTDPVRRRYGLGEPYILYVGNFKPHKNLPRLIRAYAALPGRVRATHQLVLAGGDGARRPALEELARALGVHQRVVFPGPIDDADLPALYAGAALFVLPSLEEGFGLPALEAMACGAPVVASRRAALPEVLGEAGLLVDPDDEADLAAGMARVLSDAALSDELRQRGFARARLFSPDRTSQRVIALLREVSEAHASRR